MGQPFQRVIRSRIFRTLTILVVLAGVVMTTAGFTSHPSSAISAAASGQPGASKCVISKRMPVGTGLVIARVSTGQIEYRLRNEYPRLVVNGVAYDGTYHWFSIGKGISIVRPLFSTDFWVTVSCPTYGISDPE